MLVTSNVSDLINRQDSPNLISSRRSVPGEQSGTKGPGFATDQLLAKLAQNVPGMTGPEDFKQLNAKDFSPQKVADRVTEFVALGLEQARRAGKSEEEVDNLRQQALSGIKKGFDEARNILDTMNLLTDELSTTIDDTLKLTLDGLKSLAPGATQEPIGSSRTSVLAAERYQSAETLSLKVKTQDGDEVTIKFGQQSSYQSSFGGYSDDSGSAVSFSIDRSESSQYRFSVEGELDNDEIDALQSLIKDVNAIADDFFDGDVQAAFEQASEFKLDKSELASMNLKLTRSESYSAVAAYQQVQNLNNANPNPGQKLGHMLNDLTGRVAAPALGFMESPAGFGKQLLTELIPQDKRFKEADDDKRSLLEQNLNSLRSIIDSLEGVPRLGD